MPRPAPTPPRADPYPLIGLGVGARLLGTAIGVLAGVATLSLAVRLLGTDGYGAFAFALAAATLLAGLGRLGLEPAIAREVAIRRTSEQWGGAARVARGAFTIVAATGVIGAVGTLVVIELGSEGLEAKTKLALAVGLGLVLYGSNAAAVAGAVARGAGRVISMELPNLASSLSRLAALAILTALDVVDLVWVAASYGAAALIGVAASGWVTASVLGRSRAFRPGRAAASEVFAGALPFAVVGVATIVISRFDVVVLGFTATNAEVGAYEPTLRIVEQAMLIVPLLFMAQYLPAASRMDAERDAVRFRELYVSLSKLVFVLAFPAVLVLAAFPETILRALYGDDFPVDRLVVWLLLAGFVVNLAFGLNATALSALGNRRALARTGGLAIGTMVVLAVVLVPVFGPAGAAAATSGTYVILNVAVAVALARAASGAVPARADYLATLVTSVVPLVAALAIRAWLGPIELWEAVSWALVLSAAWAAVLLRMGAIRLEELRRLLPRAAVTA